jgi:hypothetical protein
MSTEPANQKRIIENGISAGLFLVWAVMFVPGCHRSVTMEVNNGYQWWHSFPMIIAYAVVGAITSPVSRALANFVKIRFNDSVYEFFRVAAIVVWPITLPIMLMWAFFTMMGRLTA